MKRCIAGLMLCGFCLVAGGDEEYRTFTDQAGRTASLKVTACDLKRNEVTIEREDHSRHVVSISVFSEEDQAYIREWYMANELISERHLEIDCDDTLLEKRKEDVMGLEYTGASSSDRDESEYTVLGHKRFELMAYTITFKNKTDMPIQNARLEYNIFYEQSERGFDPEPEQETFMGRMALPDLEPKKEVEILTDSFEIYTDDLSTRATTGGLLVRSGRLYNADAEIHGIRARLYIKLPSGQEGMREFHHPPSLSNETYPWSAVTNVVSAVTNEIETAVMIPVEAPESANP